MLNRRPENALDLDAVFAVAVETGVAVEINGLPDRLDLWDHHAAEALAAGVERVLNSDSHSTGGLASLGPLRRDGAACRDSARVCGQRATARRAPAPQVKSPRRRGLFVLRQSSCFRPCFFSSTLISARIHGWKQQMKR